MGSIVFICSAILAFQAANGAKETVSQECVSAYEDYTGCIKEEFASSFQSLEEEYHNYYTTLANKCFSPNANGPKCHLSPADLEMNVFNGDYRPNCIDCQVAGIFMDGRILRGQKAKQTCVNPKILANMEQGMDKCVFAEYSNDFKFPVIADYDWPSATAQYEDSTVSTSNLVIIVHGKLQACQTQRKYRKKFRRTQKCIAGIDASNLRTHCSIHQKCMKKQKSSCQEEVLNMHNNVCNCALKEREMHKKRGSKVMRGVQKGLNSRNYALNSCVRELLKALISKKVNWASELDTTVQCIEDQGQKKEDDFKISNYVKRGCQKIIEEWQETRGSGKKQLESYENTRSLISFVILFMDSQIDRYTRMCLC